MMWLPRALITLGLMLIGHQSPASSIITRTTITTITELLVCTATTKTTVIVPSCPCPLFPTTTVTTSCGTACCSISTISSPLPSPNGTETLFTIDLSVPLSGGDRRITLSRIGNTIGIGGDPLTFNITDTGELRDAVTGDIAFIILPNGAIKKRFQGSIDLLIGSSPPTVAYTTAWRKTSEGDFIFRIGENSANPIDLGFGVYLTDTGEIDTSVPIQMYDISEGVPSDVQGAFGTQSLTTSTVSTVSSAISSAPSTSFSSTTITTMGTSKYETTLFPTDSTGVVTIISYYTPSTVPTSTPTSSTTISSTTPSTSTAMLRTYSLTQYGSVPATITTPINGTVYVINQLVQSTVTCTLYAPTPTTSYSSFNQDDSTITLIDYLSQYITTKTVYGGTSGYTSTPTVGDLLPTLTAIAQLTQATSTSITYGPSDGTLSLQTNSSLETVTLYVMSPATTTITSTSYLYNQPPYTTTSYGINPTATVLILSPQSRTFTTQYSPVNYTTTYGSDNPTATVLYGLNPFTSTLTTTQVTPPWNLTTISTTSFTELSGDTLTVRVYTPYPSASPIVFALSDAMGVSQFLVATSTTAYSTYTAWAAFTAPSSRCKFIRWGDYLILATDPVTGDKLPRPAYSFSILPVSLASGSRMFFGYISSWENIPNISSSFLYWRNILNTKNIFLNNQAINALANFSAAFFYKAYDPGFSGQYTPLVLNTSIASTASFLGTSYRRIDSTMFGLVTSAPTARALATLQPDMWF